MKLAAIIKRGPASVLAAAVAACLFGAPASLHAQAFPGAAGAGGADDLNRRLEQVQRETRLLASPDLNAGDRALVDYGALLTFSYFSTDTSAGDSRSLFQYDLNLYARLNFDGAHEFYVRNRLQYRDYFAGDETSTDDDGLQNYVEEAYYKFDLARYLAAYKGQASSDNLTVTAGRQFVDWGAGLVLSQYVDGLKADASLGPVGLSLLAGVTTYGTTDFDTSRPDFDKSTYRGFFGGQASYQVGLHRPYAYVLVQRDFNDEFGKNDDLSFPDGSRLKFQYDSYYVGVGSTGSLSDFVRYTVEAVYEGGKTDSGPGVDADTGAVFQTKETIQAWAGLAQLDYLFNDPRRTKASAAFIIASGDADRVSSSDTFGGSLPGTNDQAFNALGLVSTGYAFNPNLSNLAVFKTGISTFPFARGTVAGGSIPSRLQIGADLLFYGKTHHRAPIDESTTESRFLGTEFSPYLNWRLLEDVTFQVRYGVFFPGSAIPSDNTRQFLYTSLTYSF